MIYYHSGVILRNEANRNELFDSLELNTPNENLMNKSESSTMVSYELCSSKVVASGEFETTENNVSTIYFFHTLTFNSNTKT